MAKKRASWPPQAFVCGECGFSTALVTEAIDHAAEHESDATLKGLELAKELA